MPKSTTPPATSAIVLTLTLHTDGTGTVLTTRDHLASLSRFTYRDMDEVMAAIHAAAHHLLAIEAAPPPTTFSEAQPSISNTSPESPPDAAVPDDESSATAEDTSTADLNTASQSQLNLF